MVHSGFYNFLQIIEKRIKSMSFTVIVLKFPILFYKIEVIITKKV